MEWFLGYLALGGLVAYANDVLVVGEGSGCRAERVLYFVRATLAWPTYLLEDALLGGQNGTDDEEG